MAKSLKLLAGERQAGETDKAVQACNDYLRLGPGRTLVLLWRKYTKTPRNAPTDSLDTVKHWSKTFAWAERAADYDSGIEAAKNAESQRVMRDGLAQDYKRVRELQRLAGLLKREIYHKDDSGRLDNVWVEDFKQIGSGEAAEKVRIERFNSALIEQFRDTLDDIAQETGGRATKRGTADEPQHVVGWSLEDWRKEVESRRQQAAETLNLFDDDDGTTENDAGAIPG